MANTLLEKSVVESPARVDAKSGIGFTLGLLLGAAAGGIFSMAVNSGRTATVPDGAIDLGRKVEQLHALEKTGDAE